MKNEFDDKEKTEGSTFRQEDFDVETERDKKKEKVKAKINILDDEEVNIFEGRTEKNAEENQETLHKEEESEETETSETGSTAEEKIKDSMEPEDYEAMSGFVLDLFGFGVEKICGMIARESDSSKFELNEKKKLKLQSQFSRILQKHNFKITIEFLFVVSLAMSYREPIQTAFKLKKKKADPNYNKQNEETKEEESKEDKGEDFVFIDENLKPKVNREDNKVPISSRGPKRKPAEE